MSASEWTINTLREHFERIVANLERRLDERIDGQKESVTVAMAAAEKRFDGVNEFRQALGDTSRLQMPRQEAENLMKALAEKMEAADKGMAARLDAITNTVVGLQGRSTGVHSGWGYAAGAVSLIIAVLAYRGNDPGQEVRSKMGLIAFPLLIAIIGILMWALCANPVLKDAGRILFAIGAFFCVGVSAPEMVKLFGR